MSFATNQGSGLNASNRTYVNQSTGKKKNASGVYRKSMNSAGWSVQPYDYKQKNNPPSGGGGGTGGGSNGGSRRYSTSYASSGPSADELAAQQAEREAQERAAAQAAALKAAMQARTDAVNAANSALDQQGKALEGKYNTSLQQAQGDYQTLRNQNDVNYMRALYNQREALANRGALNSGAGRYENLVTGNAYNNTLNKINSQEMAERQSIQDNIANMWANIAQQKASNNNTTLDNYTSALQNIINSNYSGYSPTGSDYYQQALNTMNGAFATPTNANGGTRDGVSAYARLLASLGYDI
nr:MAG TPA: hypothetical protein [Caudoviricetes sp.]